MMPKYLTVDGMLSGTGIRDSVSGGYIAPNKLGLSKELVLQLTGWLNRYETSHYSGFSDRVEVAQLDTEGMRIADQIQIQLRVAKVLYYSHALSTVLRNK
jgi:hypothetical protein